MTGKQQYFECEGGVFVRIDSILLITPPLVNNNRKIYFKEKRSVTLTIEEEDYNKLKEVLRKR